MAPLDVCVGRARAGHSGIGLSGACASPQHRGSGISPVQFDQRNFTCLVDAFRSQGDSDFRLQRLASDSFLFIVPRLLVDISAHGLGHLGQTAPVLDALFRMAPDLDITVRSGLPQQQLARRIGIPFRHVAGATDFGYVMRNAIDPDLAATAERYRACHADWPARVAEEAAWQTDNGFDAVLANVSYLPLAGAARAGISAAALCSLNWADLFAHYYGRQPWAAAIHAEMLSAYRAARVFLRASPGMDMATLGNLRVVGPICRTRAPNRLRIAAQLGIDAALRWVLVALGGIGFPLDVSRWPACDGVIWLVPADLYRPRADVANFDAAAVDFTELLASADAVVTKPGYGTFAEAACHGLPVLYVPRGDWPEGGCLTAWLHANTRALAVDRRDLERGELRAALADLWAQPARPVPSPGGVCEAAGSLAALLRRDSEMEPGHA